MTKSSAKKKKASFAEVEANYQTETERIQKSFRPRKFGLKKLNGDSEFPEVEIKVPDSWPCVKLCPFYDVHLGSKEHDAELFERHLEWVRNTPYIVSFLGGDLIDNLGPQQAAKMGQNVLTPQEQLHLATKTFAKVQHKVAFSIAGNHEQRSHRASGIDVARQLAENLRVPYSNDYMFAIVKYRDMNIRLLAHHGSGGAQTAGAQRNAARKDLSWVHPDILITGHLHKTLTDVIFQVDYDQQTGRPFERNAVVLITPAYLRYFGGYAAMNRMAPDTRGMSSVTIKPDGNLFVEMHARGRRL